MVVALADLRKDLERALASGDESAVASVRRTIVESHPETADGAEASYKLGLEALYRRKALDEAEEHLRKAIKAKSPAWSGPARVSLAIILIQRGKMQQGVFELRKIAGAEPPTLAAAQAYGLLVMAFRDAGQKAEAERARTEHLKLLEKLTKKTDADAPVARFLLGMEHKIEGVRGPAKQHIEAAIKGGLTEPLLQQAKSALKDL